MRAEKQEQRRREIEQAAYEVLAEKGYAGASMLAIAKRAGASNETLYGWYGSKQGLFRALVEENAREVAALLRDSIGQGRDPLETLRRLGPLLLRLLLGDKAVALNRAAAADAAAGGLLGRTLAAAGRETILPLIAEVFAEARARGQVHLDSPEEAAELYISLLVGDLQIRRVTGALERVTEGEIRRRVERAVGGICRLSDGREPVQATPNETAFATFRREPDKI